MGSDSHTISFAGRIAGWTNNHSVDAALISTDDVFRPMPETESTPNDWRKLVSRSGELPADVISTVASAAVSIDSKASGGSRGAGGAALWASKSRFYSAVMRTS